MKPITDVQATAIIQTIVDEFGDGTFRQGKYLFEQLTRLPTGPDNGRLAVGVALNQICDSEQTFVVLFDSHPNNRSSVTQAVESLDLPNTIGLVTSPSDLARLLAFDQCDMYVTTRDGRLLIVACHEDDVVNGERIVWAVSPTRAKP